MEKVLRPGRRVQRRRKVQCEKPGKESRGLFIWASHFPHKPQDQLISHPFQSHWAALRKISVVLVNPGLCGCSIYIPPGAMAAAEAAGSLLLLGSMVKPEGKVPNESSEWAA